MRNCDSGDTCPNPACDRNLTPEQIAEYKAKQAARDAEKARRERLRRWGAKYGYATT